MSNFWEYEITSQYGNRTDPFTGKASNHNGVDFALPLDTEVKSNVNGTVWAVEYQEKGFGNYVIVADSSGKFHYYAHLNQASVQMGDYISVGDTLGLSGSTGRSTGPHLHYEVRDVLNKKYDPNDYITNISSPVEGDNVVNAIKNYTTGKISESALTIAGTIFKWLSIVGIAILMVYCLYVAIDM